MPKVLLPGWEIPTKSMDPLIVGLKALFDLIYNESDFRRSLQRRAVIATTLALSAATAQAVTVTEATQYWANTIEGGDVYSVGYSCWWCGCLLRAPR
jgi:hypothetical protein